jgi:hypothetical protein
MEMTMPRIAFALASLALLSAPAAAQSISTLLPLLTYPDPVTTGSTKDCGIEQAPVCKLHE